MTGVVVDEDRGTVARGRDDKGVCDATMGLSGSGLSICRSADSLAGYRACVHRSFVAGELKRTCAPITTAGCRRGASVGAAVPVAPGSLDVLGERGGQREGSDLHVWLLRPLTNQKLTECAQVPREAPKTIFLFKVKRTLGILPERQWTTGRRGFLFSDR